MGRSLQFVVPGALDQRTGGYIYDRKIVDGLRSAGWSVEVFELAGQFPDVDDEAIKAASEAVRDIRGGVTVIDGLALPAFDGLVEHLPRPWVGLIHHPLAMETGLSTAEVAAFVELESRLMRQADKLIVTSPMTRRNLAGFDVDPNAVSVVIPGVEPAAPAAGPSVGPNAEPGPGLPKSLLCVGTLTQRKGHLVLLQALARLVDLDWHLKLVGSAAWDPDHARQIERLVEDESLSIRVSFIGEQDDEELSALYQQADLFVLASHHEGYGMVLAEALARGLPIVSTTAGAIPDTVPGAAGRLVPAGDVDALAAALRQVLTDHQLYQNLREGALEARRTLPSWAEVAGRFSKELEGLNQP